MKSLALQKIIKEEITNVLSEQQPPRSVRLRRGMAVHRVLKNPGGVIASVKQLQTKLDELGYSVGPFSIDGDYGKDTTAAVKNFQQRNNLTVDGLAGKNTLAVLMKAPPADADTKVGSDPDKIKPTGDEVTTDDPGGIIVVLNNVKAEDPKQFDVLLRTYRAVRTQIQLYMERLGVSRASARNASDQFLDPNASKIGISQSKEKAKALILANFGELLKKGVSVKVEKADINLSGKQIQDLALRIFGAYSSGDMKKAREQGFKMPAAPKKESRIAKIVKEEVTRILSELKNS